MDISQRRRASAGVLSPGTPGTAAAESTAKAGPCPAAGTDAEAPRGHPSLLDPRQLVEEKQGAGKARPYDRQQRNRENVLPAEHKRGPQKKAEGGLGSHSRRADRPRHVPVPEAGKGGRCEARDAVLTRRPSHGRLREWGRVSPANRRGRAQTTTAGWHHPTRHVCNVSQRAATSKSWAPPGLDPTARGPTVCRALGRESSMMNSLNPQTTLPGRVHWPRSTTVKALA